MAQTDILKYFKGKKVTLMGLGLLGRGVNDARFLAKYGADLIVTDLKREEDLRPSVLKLREFPNIIYHLGEHRFEDFENRNFIIRAPNAPLDSPYLARARELGIPVEMDASLFAKLTPTTIIGVTGTRGKSTVAHLVYEIAKAAGKNIYLGGNEKGVATLPLLEKTAYGDIALLELDSWQLQGFEESAISPHVSVWTNFFRDHMNYYKNDMDRYFRDKAAIARFQKGNDYFITTPEVKEKIESAFGPLKATCITDAALPADWEVGLPGEHNRKNAAYALAAAQCLGISDDVAKEVIRSFSPLPNRLEFLGEKNGIGFYNDSNATTPEATIAALRTLKPEGRPIVLIAGGSDKELEFADMAEEIKKMAKSVVLFEGTATEKLIPLLSKNLPVVSAKNMSDAFEKALRHAKPGDIVLLSPGATSFGIFKNEYDRGEQFDRAVKALK